MMADPAFIADRKDKLLGLVITHAHEDHIGAVAWLWPQLKCPVYCTPFAAVVLRRKLGEVGLANQVRVHVIPPGGTIDLKPFALRFIRMAHSIPEAQALVIDTPAGTVLHTGDWKLDANPLVGPPTDEAALAELGDKGVLAIVCDSTNAMVEGHSGSELDVRRSLTALIRDLRGRVAVTCFASNVARMESVALAARDAGRSVAIVGRSLRNMDAAARECGYLKTLPPFLTEDDIDDVDDDNILMLITGSQGEDRSALSRIARDDHPRVSLGEGDTVIYSSRMIPGNERAIGTVQDNLVRRGVRLMTDDDHLVHVSGHPARDELRRMYRLVKPRYAIPVHGEWRHLSAHAELAREAGATPFMMEDGDIITLSPGRPAITDSAPVGRLVLDGTRIVPLKGEVMAARRRMLFNGIVVASIAVDQAGALRGRPKISAPGLLDPDDPETDRVSDDFAGTLRDLPANLRRDDAALEDAARSALRRTLGRKLGKRPMVDVHLIRV
jgi:ribonuclease J